MSKILGELPKNIIEEKSLIMKSLLIQMTWIEKVSKTCDILDHPSLSKIQILL